ncbi:hypothetical protein SAMN05216357_1359 [Porphyromonadaceae bacterium KH3CP3RA]|nr:hypothetical protein SAMN05216357_1359 [Porphyromonadaceae bacterium KH3CP3RA]
MKKQLIYFDEYEYNTAKKQLVQFVERVNRAIPIITEIEPVNEEMILQITDNSDYIKKIRYNEKIQMYCDQFMIPRSSVTFEKHEFIFKLANAAIQYLYRAKEIIGGLSYINSYLLKDKYFVIENNIVTITPDTDKKLRERFTYYAETEKEKKAFDLIQDIISNLNELKEMTGAGTTEIEKLYNFDYYGNKKYKINIKNFKQISK